MANKGDGIVRLRMDPGGAVVLGEELGAGVAEREVRGRLMEFNRPVDRWWGTLEFAPGSLATGAVKGGDIPALWAHDMGEQVGDVTELIEAEGGVDVVLRLSMETQRGRELYALADAGMLSGLSPGVRILKYEVQDGEKKLWDEKRRATEIELVEVSLVPVPAERSARVKMADAAPVPVRALYDVVRDAAGRRF